MSKPILLFSALLLPLFFSGCSSTSQNIRLQITDAEGMPIAHALVASQLKSKRFLRPVVEGDAVLKRSDAAGRVKLPKVRAKGSAGWGDWAQWVYITAAGYEPFSGILAQFESSSTTVKREWVYPLGTKPVIRLEGKKP